MVQAASKRGMAPEVVEKLPWGRFALHIRMEGAGFRVTRTAS